MLIHLCDINLKKPRAGHILKLALTGEGLALVGTWRVPWESWELHFRGNSEV